MKKVCVRRFISLGLLFGVALACVSCTPKQPGKKTDVSGGVLTAVSDTGVTARIPVSAETEKQVGIFYFIWEGTQVGASYSHVYDNTEILKNIDFSGGRTHITPQEWAEAGGGGNGTWHWWGQPLFGYYDMTDEWVIARHVQMLTEAGVDFLVIDQTNGVLDGYIKRINLLFETLYKFKQQGLDVPQVAMMCYDDGPGTVDKLYVQFYAKHPEYADLFYHWNGHEKPVIFDNISSYNKTASGTIDTEKKLASYSEGARDFFEFRDVAFPHETKNNQKFGKSFLYLDFRPEPKAIPDEEDGGYSFCNVSVAEINVTNHSSDQWFKETYDRTRNFDGTRNRQWTTDDWKGEPDAYLYGYNFARQFEFAIQEDPDLIFITGWNEWMAQIRASGSSVTLIDNADINNSRDIEPMKDGYGDNYYIQMCDFISRFKYGTVSRKEAPSCTVDVKGDFAQWDRDGILTYTDSTGEIAGRDHEAACDWKIKYETADGVNDFKTVKVAADGKNVYFYVETAADIQQLSANNRMTLFLNTGSGQNWYGYDYVINRTGETDMKLEKCGGGWKWTEAGTVSYQAEGSRLMLAVPRSALGLSSGRISLSFKWADGFTDNDFWSFYTEGDAAPYGRMNYLY